MLSYCMTSYLKHKFTSIIRVVYATRVVNLTSTFTTRYVQHGILAGLASFFGSYHQNSVLDRFAPLLIFWTLALGVVLGALLGEG